MRMVPAARLELARANAPRILSPLCLPFHHAGTGNWFNCFTSYLDLMQVVFYKNNIFFLQ
jgi:hypothetical protein